MYGETLDGGEVEVCARIVLDPENMPCDLYDNQAIRNILDQAIRDINKQVPAYKAIRYYVYGYKELVKTTTLKIKRYVETNRIHKALESLAITIKNACGKNFDVLEAADSKAIERVSWPLERIAAGCVKPLKMAYSIALRANEVAISS